MAGRRKSPGMTNDIYITMIPVSIVTGIIAWFLCNRLYSSILDLLPRPLVIGIVFVVLYALLLIVVVVVAILGHEYQGNAITFLLSLLPGALAVLALSTLFQFIYGLNLRSQTSGPTSYVFIIDDSGSTSETDPGQLRYKAVSDVLKGSDATMSYMIYSFSDSTVIAREMGPAASGEQSLTGNSSGGTSIRGALETVINDFRDGIWNGGDAPKVVLLTDGYATDIDLFHSVKGVLKEYADEGISVSTVGLGDADDDLMTQIAETTGGVYIAVSDAAELSNAMTKAARTGLSRDLVTARHMRKLNLLYGFLRILFITMIGILMGGLIAFAYGNQDSYIVSTGASVVFSLIGALIMEFFTGVFHFNERAVWFILWIFLAVTIVLKRYIKQLKATDLYQIDNGMYSQNYGTDGQGDFYSDNDYFMQ